MNSIAVQKYNLSRQTKIFMYSKNRIFPQNPVFLKILCLKIYGTLLMQFLNCHETVMLKIFRSADNICHIILKNVCLKKT